jgi:PAS domain S-box-containing protein
MTKTIEQLMNENEELHSRLAETEETLKAILSGEVDAILVSGAKGECVYSISSAETPYRTFIEKMNEGAVTLSREGTILYCNQRFAELVDEPIERVIGSYLKRFISPNDISKLDHLLAQQIHNKSDFLIVSLINTNYLKLSFHLLPAFLGGENCIFIATDITEMKKKENELIELHRLLKQQFNKIKGMRIELINEKIGTEVVLNKLEKTNEKLGNEIKKLKIFIEEISQKFEQNQETT